jgi:tRNA threonylcarbamoyladenosine biosynthesis protein TsaE
MDGGILGEGLAGRVHTTREEDTLSIAERLGRGLARLYPDGVVVLLVGPLGAGKTVMARGIARAIGVEEPVTSPTYTIISDYQAPGGTLHHVDLYRIEGSDQMENLGLEDIMRGGGIVLIEWGEKLEQAGGAVGLGPHVRVTISVADDGGRDISVEERRA